jgi:hypothetical protein
MRCFAIALLVLGGAAALPGCGSEPPDPYSNIRMLTPEELGSTSRAVDPVEQAEKAQNAQFTRDRKSP